jgi:hypothetical protein
MKWSKTKGKKKKKASFLLLFLTPSILLSTSCITPEASVEAFTVVGFVVKNQCGF